MRGLTIILILLAAPTRPEAQLNPISKAKDFHQVNCDSAIHYSDQVLLNNGTSDSATLQALFIKGWNQALCGEYDASIPTFRQYIAHPASVEAAPMYIRIVGRIGVAFREIGRLDSALIYLEHYDKLVDKYLSPNAIEAKLEIGEVYRYMGRLDESNKYKIEAIERARRSGEQISLTMALYYYLDDNSGDIGLPEFQPFLDEYLELVGRMKEDGSMDYSHTAMKLLDASSMPELDDLRQDISRVEPIHRSKGYLFLNQALAKRYYDRGRYQDAYDVSLQGLETSLDRTEALYVRQFYQLLGATSEKLDKPEMALKYFKAYENIKDSLMSVEVLANIDSLKIQFETVEKEKHIADQELQIQKQKNQRNILFAVVALLLWFGAFVVLFLLNRNRMQKRLAMQEAAISQQQILQLEQEKQLLAMNSMIEGQEAERMRIAQDLHDGLGGLLGTIKARFSVIKKEIDLLESMDVYAQVNELINTASVEVRRISHNMAPHALRLGTLKDALSDLATQLENNDLHVDFQWSGSLCELEQSRQVMLFRIAQELTTNVIKHAEASTLLIQVNCFDKELNLIIEDNGRGFDPASVEVREGLGLTSIESRVHFLNGEMDMDTSPGKGTSVTIQVPCNIGKNTGD